MICYNWNVISIEFFKTHCKIIIELEDKYQYRDTNENALHRMLIRAFGYLDTNRVQNVCISAN